MHLLSEACRSHDVALGVFFITLSIKWSDLGLKLLGHPPLERVATALKDLQTIRSLKNGEFQIIGDGLNPSQTDEQEQLLL